MTRLFSSIRHMKRPEFEHALAVHGADLAQWPAELRARADLLLAGDPAAHGLMAQAAQLDALLPHGLPVPSAADTASAARVAARLSAHALPAQDRPFPAFALPGWLLAFDLRPAWPSIAALAGMAMLGFLAGSHAVGSGLLDARQISHRVVVSDADVSSIMFEPDPLTETGL